MKLRNKILSLFLSVIMIFSLMSLNVSAEKSSGECGENLTWIYDETTKTLTISGIGDMYDYNLGPYDAPWKNYKEITTTLLIQDGVTSIGEHAFSGFGDLNNVSISDSVEKIGYGAFEYCHALDDIIIPDSVTEIGNRAFYDYSKFTSISLPISVEKLGSEMFPARAIIYYPGTKEQWRMIEKESQANNLYYRAYCSDGELLPLGTCGDNVVWTVDMDTGILTLSGEGEMYNYNYTSRYVPWADVEDLIINVCVESGVTAIGEYAFVRHDSIKKISIADSVTEIKKWAFGDSLNLASVTIPINVTAIGNVAFPKSTIIHYQGTKSQWQDLIGENAPSLFYNQVHCSDGVLNPAGSCGESLTWFFDNGTGTLTISGTGEMEDYSVCWDDYYNQEDNRPWAAIKDYIKFVEIEDTVTSIGKYAFYECGSLEKITVGNGLISIGERAFAHSALLDFTIPETVTKIGEYAFNSCVKLKNIMIPHSVTEMGKGAFYSCASLKNVKIGDGVTKIGKDCFCACKSLEKVVLGKNVEIIDEYAFEECQNLSEMIVHSSLEQIKEFAFLRSRRMTIYHSGTKEDLRKIKVNNKSNTMFCMSKFCFDNGEIAGLYGNDTIWFYDEATSTVTISGSGEKYNLDLPYTNLPGWYYYLKPKNIIIEDGAKIISNCSSEGVQTVLVPESVKEIQQGAFSKCSNLSTIYYLGSIEQWNEININTKNNVPLLNAQIIYNYCRHKYTLGQSTPATCTKHGVANYICEGCGDNYWEYSANPTGHTLNEDGVCEVCGEKEVSASHINTQMLSVESVLAMVMSLLAKLFGIFTVA